VGRKLLFLAACLVVLSGCATASRSQNQTMTSQLQFRVGDLERQIEGRDQQIKQLEYDVKDLSYEVGRLQEELKRARGGSSSRSTSGSSGAVALPGKDEPIIRIDVDPKDVQTALKNAGYYSGAIDGKVGSGTKSAIVQFQKDNNLKADGLMGNQTWNELKAFLNR